MTSNLTSMEQTSSVTLSSRTTNRIIFTFILGLLGFMLFGAPLSAQTPVATAATYSGFPTCSSTDGRFLTIAGPGYHTLENTAVVLKVGSPGVATTIEIGIFDGETGGMWDQGNKKLKYHLYADPTGQGTGTVKVAEFKDDDMVDNGWATFVVTNVEAARAPNGNYLYCLVVSTNGSNSVGNIVESATGTVVNVVGSVLGNLTRGSSNSGSGSSNSGSGSSNSGSGSSNSGSGSSGSSSDNFWSSFKVRTTGTVALKAQAFTVCATANTDQDLAVIYPAGTSNLENTTYDGTWSFFLDVPSAASSFSVWDGDMDFGSYDCSVRDIDDLNTSNTVLPDWTSDETTNLEGVGIGSACVGTTGYSTGTPPDDNRYPMYRRSPAVYYDVVTPQGQVFTNSNPSGSKEWEEFKLTTSAYNANLNDAHIDSIPAGIYEVRVTGMDLANLNAWRFYSDAIGVDEDGQPTEPIRAFAIDGTVKYQALARTTTTTTTPAVTTTSTSNDDDDDNGRTSGTCASHRAKKSCRKRTTCRTSTTATTTTPATTTTTTVVDSTYAPVKNVTVTLHGDVNGDGVDDVEMTTITDADGYYSFDNVGPGTYHVTVAPAALPAGAACASDYDGVSTPNTATVVIAAGASNPDEVCFSYRAVPVTTTTTTTTTTSSSSSTTGTSTTIGVHTASWWATHSSNWPVSSVSVGGTTYTKTRAIELMGRSSVSDKTYEMFKELVAAKLNVAAGARSSCILYTITQGSNWLSSYRLGSYVGSSACGWRHGSSYASDLADYNNGRSCAARVQ